MRKTTLTYFLVVISSLGIFNNELKSQIIFNNGGLIYIGPATTMQVNGGFQNDNTIGGPGTCTNSGNMVITSNGNTPGNIYNSNNAVLQGDGKYILDQDWINNATFNADSGTVVMDGNNKQLITSNNGTITTFDTLVLSGTGLNMNRRKQQTLDTKVSGALLLNDRVLFTAGHSTFITTPDPNAVLNSTAYDNEGFVSSIGAGSLSRVTNSTNSYYFPVGADSTIVRYRKVILTPASANPNTYTVRLANNDATINGDSIGLLDTSLCKVNSLFYHQITHPVGNDSTDIDIFYDTNKDGTWFKLAEWNTPKTNMWNDLGAVTNILVPSYSDVLKAKWGNFSNNAFILGASSPKISMGGKASICYGESTLLTASGGSSYVWNTGITASSLSVSPVSDTTYFVTVSNGKCSSKDSAKVLVNPVPMVNVCCSSSIINGDSVQLTASIAQVYSWSPTVGLSCSNCENPVSTPQQTTTYTLTVTSDSGCVAQSSVTIDVTCGEVFVPSAFSPNGDGQNDILYVKGPCIKTVDFMIFDRWGNKIFESENLNSGWDGKDKGQAMNTGTYVYYLNATLLDGSVVEKKGNISLVR